MVELLLSMYEAPGLNSLNLKKEKKKGKFNNKFSQQAAAEKFPSSICEYWCNDVTAAVSPSPGKVHIAVIERERSYDWGGGGE